MQAEISSQSMENEHRVARPRVWIYDVLLIIVLLGAAFFRFTGLEWDEFTWMHPDERFLIWVTSDIRPVSGIGEYFNTPESTLNPNNVGHGFFVYGTFPIFVTRYLVSWLFDSAGWQEVASVGRPLSALFDLLTIGLVYLTAAKLYNRRTALLAAGLLAAAVLPIQLSHFYKEDTFLNFFTLLAIYFGVRIATYRRKSADSEHETTDDESPGKFSFRSEWLLFVGFGVALGLGVASKLNAFPVAFVLPLAVFIRFYDLPAIEKNRNLATVVGLIALSAGISLLVFRIAQPYAFSGPGLFGIRPNPQWVANIQEQRNQAAGDIDFPPSLQWARRPVWFGLQNILFWGIGLPFGILAVVGFLWMGWRILHGEWRQHLIVWLWAGAYFIWQSLQFNPTMRYFLPIYPMLAIFAGWTIDQLWQRWRNYHNRKNERKFNISPGLYGVIAIFTAILVIGFTYLYAFAFTRIQNSSFTRAEASRWIFENIPGPINILVATENIDFNQIVSVPYNYLITSQTPFYTSFLANKTGIVEEIRLHEVIDQYQLVDNLAVLAKLEIDGEDTEPMMISAGSVDLPTNSAPIEINLQPDRDAVLTTDQNYRLKFEPTTTQPGLTMGGEILLFYDVAGEIVSQSFDFDSQLFNSQNPISINFTPTTSGVLRSIALQGELHNQTSVSPLNLTLMIADTPSGENIVSSGNVHLDESSAQEVLFELDEPFILQEGELFYLTLSLDDEAQSGIYLRGEAVANEGEWDDGLPLRMDGYDPYGGIYQKDLNFNMYWDDNPEKLARFERILDQTKYIFISSSRQWGTLPRLPERFPLTTQYYRSLIGCPDDRTIEWCYNVAEPGMFQGELGFNLVEVINSNPRIGNISINDQFAEEAFTVYDHPKVFIFQKSSGYSAESVSEILGSVDLSHVIRVTPKRAATNPMDLMLPQQRQITQQNGGTWAELFDTNNIVNSHPFASVIVWYLFILLLGAALFPILRLVLPGLADRGYPLSRIAGLLLLAYFTWITGSAQIPVSRLTILVIFVALIVLGGVAAFLQRKELGKEIWSRRNYYLFVELLALAAFLFFLYVRWGNPDLWHPWKGGEKPMDFSYFNAVLKSSTFPPYDPWYSGGYINYYYYGFVLMGVPVKLLGIVPAVAYNLILPTLFMLILLGAFTLGYNLLNPPGRRVEYLHSGKSVLRSFVDDLVADRGILIGLIASLFVGVLGNLGTLRMITRGYQMIGGPGTIEGANFFNRIVWGISGFFKTLAGAEMPYGVADWYWLPSRAIAALGDVEPITEFPYFTILYGDMHAHLIALPITLFVLAWGLSVIQSRARWGSAWNMLLGLIFGGLAIGALQPTNTWDLPTYLVLGLLALGYGALRRENFTMSGVWGNLPTVVQRWLPAFAMGALLAGISVLLYIPYSYWYGQGYNAIDFWQGSRTPISDYLVHWGLYLFLIVSWMLYESMDWMAKTPVSELRKLDKYRLLIWGCLIISVLVILLLALDIPGFENPLISNATHVVWIAVPLAIWAGILLLRPNQTDEKRVILFLIGSGLVLSLLVEIIVLRGDIGRMNTVFKFYYQVWILFAISAAASIGWILQVIPGWNSITKNIWRFGLASLMIACAMYPLLATTAKIKDRMAPETPRSLDGLEYMKFGHYFDQGIDLTLAYDYEAVRWMQENIPGSPVIMEGNTPEYRWGSRFSINTGLPSVVGWNWHQRQQRGGVISADWITDRIGEVNLFYNTPEAVDAYRILDKYGVEYFVVGQLEGAYYAEPGLAKFQNAEGVYWEPVYQSDQTTVYKVLDVPVESTSN